MKILPPEPNPGERISAALLRELIRAVRARTPIAGTGVKLRETPNGTVISAQPAAAESPAQDRRYWVFSCSVDEDTNERTGGWKNCKFQCGYKFVEDDGTGAYIDGLDTCDDGNYYLKVNFRQWVYALVCDANVTIPSEGVDPENDCIYIWIGKVEYAKQTEGIYVIPVAYHYV